MPHLLLEYYILSYFYYKLDFHKPQGRLYNDDYKKFSIPHVKGVNIYDADLVFPISNGF